MIGVSVARTVIKNRVGSFRKHSFVLDYDYDPVDYGDECKKVWCKMIEQAMDEYISFKFSRIPKERTLYYNARDFLFDDHYKFFFGSQELNLTELLDQFHLDADWIRLGIRMKEEKINQDNDYQSGAQLPLF